MSVDELLGAYAAGELEGPDRSRVAEAVARSPRLQADLARYQLLLVLLAEAAREEVAAPGDLAGRIDRHLAVRWYLAAAGSLLDDLLRSYGRALVYYLGLG